MATVVTMALHSVHSVSKHTVSLNEACTALLEPLSSSFYSFLSSIFFSFLSFLLLLLTILFCFANNFSLHRFRDQAAGHIQHVVKEISRLKPYCDHV